MKRPNVQTAKRLNRSLGIRHSVLGTRHPSPSRQPMTNGRGPLDVWTFGRLDVYSATGEAELVPDARLEAILPADLIHDDEIIILLLRPSLLYIILGSLGGLLVILVATLFLALLAATAPWIIWTEQQAYLLGIGLGAARLGWQTLDWFNRIFILTDRRLLTRSGILRVTVFETRLRSVQHTTVFRRLRERVCGLGSIGIATAGSDAFDTFWVMLRQPFRVRKIIVDAIQRYGCGGPGFGV